MVLVDWMCFIANLTVNIKRLNMRGNLFCSFPWVIRADIFCFLPQTDYRGDDDWHREQLHTIGQVESQLRAELEESHKQMKCAHDTQQEQKNKMQSLRYTTYIQ